MGRQAPRAGCMSELSAIRDLDPHNKALALALWTLWVWFGRLCHPPHHSLARDAVRRERGGQDHP